MTQQEILQWLSSQQPNVVEKDLVTNLFGALYGDEYHNMQSEIQKYDFKKESRGGGKDYTFLMSKHKAHTTAMYNMGVCVAPDDQLWNSPDFWQLIIFDKDRDAHGGAIFRTIESEGEKYLVLSIQPSSSILNVVSPEQVFNKIIQLSKFIMKKMKYKNVLIPVKSAIHSNRGSMQGIIAKKYGNTESLKNIGEHKFSYSPHSYSYDEFYIVY